MADRDDGPARATPRRTRAQSDEHLSAIIHTAVNEAFDEKLEPLFESIGFNVSTHDSRKLSRLDLEWVRARRLEGEADRRAVRTKALGALVMGILALAGGGIATYVLTLIRTAGAHS